MYPVSFTPILFILGLFPVLKVTKKGVPVCDFSDPPNKQPYERIIFASCLGRNKYLKMPEDKKIIISVPSAIHSHKPPLTGKFWWLLFLGYSKMVIIDILLTENLA